MTLGHALLELSNKGRIQYFCKIGLFAMTWEYQEI